MKYYALFLNTNGFIEQCLALMRYICNPSSKNYPHITVRVYKNDHMGIDEIIQERITYVNMIEAGAFNLDIKTEPYTVYIRFESEELEALDYKPDYPLSFMHLTIYDGNDYDFATALLKELKTISWKVRLSFSDPLYLKTNTIGKKKMAKSYKDTINKAAEEILGLSSDELDKQCTTNESKLQRVHRVLQALNNYYSKEHINIPDSTYNSSAKLGEEKASLFFKGDPNLNIIKDNAKTTVFVTPPEYAREMALIAFTYFDPMQDIYFGDSAIGTGALFLALLRYLKEKEQELKIVSAIGIDIDQKLALEAKKRYSGRGLKIIWGDSLLPQIQTYLERKRNLMLVNPPYSRFEDIDNEYRKKIQKYAYDQTGIKVSGRTALYVYHIMIMDKWLDNNGVAVWLIPSIFIQTHYGKALRTYLLNNVRLLHIHLYSVDRLQFEKAMVSTCLLVFKKSSFHDYDEVNFTIGDSINKCISGKVSKRKLIDEINDWKTVFDTISYEDKEHIVKKDEKKIVFSDLFTIKRGIATGANDFFVMTEEEVLERKIPDFAVKPVLPKARYLTSTVIEGDIDGCPSYKPRLFLLDCELDEEIIKDKYPTFYDYLQTAKIKINGRAITDRTLIKNRKVWYKQESRESPLYVLTYMGRTKKNLPPLYFLLNKTRAVALNTYICLYPKEWLKEVLEKDEGLKLDFLNALNSTAENIVAKQTRMYAGTFQKIEPNELKKLAVINLPEVIQEAAENNINRLNII